MRRMGVSRVVTEVVILVIAVTLALLIFPPVASYIFGAIQKVFRPGNSQAQYLHSP